MNRRHHVSLFRFRESPTCPARTRDRRHQSASRWMRGPILQRTIQFSRNKTAGPRVRETVVPMGRWGPAGCTGRTGIRRCHTLGVVNRTPKRKGPSGASGAWRPDRRPTGQHETAWSGPGPQIGPLGLAGEASMETERPNGPLSGTRTLRCQATHVKPPGSLKRRNRRPTPARQQAAPAGSRPRIRSEEI